MHLENQNYEEVMTPEVFPFSENSKPDEQALIAQFQDSFEGIYLFAGIDFEQQIKFAVAQALKLEGALGVDTYKNIEMIKAISGTIMKDPEMRETAALVIDRLGK